MSELLWAAYGAGFVVLGLFLLLLAKILFERLTPYSAAAQLAGKDNPAVGVVLLGYLAGATAILCGAFAGPAPAAPTIEAFAAGALPVAGYALAGMIVLLLNRFLTDRLILSRIADTKAIVEERNPAVGLVHGAGFFASGLVVSGALRGGVDPATAAGAFVLGQAALVLYARIYQGLTPFDDQEQLGVRRNLALAAGLAGNLTAYGIILMQGLSMAGADLLGWSDRLQHFAYYAVAGAILLPLVRFVLVRLFLPHAKLSEEIVRDQNINAGLLEGGLAIAAGVILASCL